MRLLLASDLHYSLPQFDWVLEQAPDFDVVVLAGDHIDISSPVPLESQIVVVQTYVKRLAAVTKPVVCSGNHDLTARNAHDEKSAPWINETARHGAATDWSTIAVGDVGITICPWWDGPMTRDDVDVQLREAAAERGDMWIWIYHFPPDGSPVSWTGTRHIGDTDLNDWIDAHEPDLVLTGHIHDSPFHDAGSWLARLGETWVVNAGHMGGAMPAHAIIDTSSRTAEWWSPLGRRDARSWAQ